MNYSEFLEKKITYKKTVGFDISEVNSKLFDFQQDIVKWALRIGKAAIFSNCGTGKTAMQLGWADKVREHKGDVLIVTPLAVAKQTIKEAEKFGIIGIEYKRDGVKSKTGITITNYEMLKNFNPDDYSGIVLDESSILKSLDGKTKTDLISLYGNIEYQLACTATPSPNDFMELGNHSEFLNIMTRTEMLSMFFVHDGRETQKWRLKKHAEEEFWRWVCTWAVMLNKPSDLGYDDSCFNLPDLFFNEHIVESKNAIKKGFFPEEAKTLIERQKARKESLKERCEKAAEIANSVDNALIWCDRNDESYMLHKLVDNSIEVKGSDTYEHKEKAMFGFSDGTYKKLISKPSICGFGMNWQHCNTVIFTGLSDSYEQFYQALRRVYRFGQKQKVNCHIVISDKEGQVLKNITRKEKQAQKMSEMLVKHMSIYNKENIHKLQKQNKKYKANNKIVLPNWI